MPEAVLIPGVRPDRPIEGKVAHWYANNTGKLRYEFEELADRIAPMLAPGSRVLEVAPGPGYFALALAKRGNFAVTGLDLSHTFVEMAQRSADEQGIRVDFRQGSASAMPFPGASFDFLLCRAAFKNFGEPLKSMQEMHRVLRPGGQGVIIDMRHDATPEAIEKTVRGMNLDVVNRFITKLIFRFSLTKSAYTRQQFEAMLAKVPFSKTRIDEDGIGFEIWMTK